MLEDFDGRQRKELGQFQRVVPGNNVMTSQQWSQSAHRAEYHVEHANVQIARYDASCRANGWVAAKA
jgi:hypothetical protein